MSYKNMRLMEFKENYIVDWQQQKMLRQKEQQAMKANIINGKKVRKRLIIMLKVEQINN